MKYLAASALIFVVACGDDPVDPDVGCATIFTGDVVPTGKDALFDYLKCQRYAHFDKESAPHASTGPHSTSVRTYINGALFASLDANAGEHPKGAAAVKVFLESDGTTPKGWAVMVKTSSSSAGGQGWYWYEIFSATDGSSPAAQSNGASVCTSCHQGSARDFYLSPHPLQ